MLRNVSLTTCAAMWQELEKLAAGAPTTTAQPMESGEGAHGETIPLEPSPAHGVVASRVEQLSETHARGIPVIQPPPGYTYAPELQQFVPNMEDPAWMRVEQAAEAARKQAIYEQGFAAGEAVHQQAQVEQPPGPPQPPAGPPQGMPPEQMQQQGPPEAPMGPPQGMPPGGAEDPSMQEGPPEPKPKRKPAKRGVTIRVGT